jgi:tellurite resistance protein TehA-like permease
MTLVSQRKLATTYSFYYISSVRNNRTIKNIKIKHFRYFSKRLKLLLLFFLPVCVKNVMAAPAKNNLLSKNKLGTAFFTRLEFHT